MELVNYGFVSDNLGLCRRNRMESCVHSRAAAAAAVQRRRGQWQRTRRLTLRCRNWMGTQEGLLEAVETVLHVDRARLLDVDSISRKYARVLPRAIWEALTDRMRGRQWESALKVFGLLCLQEWYDPKVEIYIKV
ncbi:unnamed protein product [Calypogeia fissa]